MRRQEVTSASVATQAAKLLNGKRFAAAEAWLMTVAEGYYADHQRHAKTLLDACAAMRSVAASALTQRPDRMILAGARRKKR